MGFELGVTEVGPAEYPLLDVLRDSIFGEVGHRSLASIAEVLDGRKDVLTLIAHLEGNPVGFKVGCQEKPGLYHSRSGGVLKDYRRLGLGRRMQDWQHQFAKARGYQQVYFNTFNHFPGMMLFGLASGFLPVGAEWRGEDSMSFKFIKELGAPETKLTIPVAAIDPAPQLEVDHEDAAQLHALISAGCILTGVRHDPVNNRISVLVRRRPDV